MHLPALITDLAIILLTAGVVTVLFKKIKQPLVLGYLLAGFLIGPYMPYFFTVTDTASISTWSEIGIIILMFGLGLEFNFHKLVSVGGTAVITAMTEVAGMLVLGYLVGQAMGWGMMDSIFLGGMLSMSSTTIIIKAFDELNVRQEGFAQLVFGTLVIEDIAGIFMMIILSTVSVSQSVSGGALALQLGMLVLYLALWLVLGIFLLPTLLQRWTPLMSDETLLITALGICFGMVLLADALGFSSALGAFLAGSLLAGTVHAERVEHLTSGVKDLFGSVFFISVGMMLDPAMIVKYIVPILILSLVTVAGKLCISSAGVLLSGQSLRSAVRCGCSLAQIGEFAFIIATLGQNLGVIADYIYPIIVSVSIVTTLTTPFFIKSADRVYALVCRVLPDGLVQRLERDTEDARSQREQDSDWGVFLRRYLKVTVFYGALMLGVSIISELIVMPILAETPLKPWMTQGLCTVLCAAGIALFIRPMLDLHSVQYTNLWVKNRGFHLPLTALTGLRLLLIVLIAFLSVQAIWSIHGLWLLLPIAGVVLLIYKTGWMSAAYISAEARFLANFNERSLQRSPDDDTQWLDEALLVAYFPCGEALAGKTLKELGWGHSFGVNVIKLIRGKRQINMPSGHVSLRAEDHIFVIGEAEPIRTLYLSLGLPEPVSLPTLRSFTAGEGDSAGALYACAIPVDGASPLKGRSIRESGLRERFDCMILGVQRNKLPILQPDVNMVMQSGDLVWVLGTKHMANLLLAADFGPAEVPAEQNKA